ncbi:MAG: response regulator transcription factor [Terriglobales bacterium]
MSHRIRILLVDDSPLIRGLIRTGIQERTNWLVCGEAENGKDAVEMVNELKPDVVILDLQMPVMNGLEAAQHIAQIAPSTLMLMFTMHKSEQLVRMAQQVGIKDVLSKSGEGTQNVIFAIRNILESQTSTPASTPSPNPSVPS